MNGNVHKFNVHRLIPLRLYTEIEQYRLCNLVSIKSMLEGYHGSQGKRQWVIN